MVNARERLSGSTRRRGLGLRTRLLLPLALGMVPFLLAITFLFVKEREQEMRHAFGRAVLLTRIAADIHSAVIRETQVLMEALSTVPSVRAGSVEECMPVLREAAQRLPWVAGLWVADAGGRAVCGNSRNGLRLPFVGDRPYFMEALRTDRFTLSGYVLSRTTQLPMLIAALPLHGSGAGIDRVLLVGIMLSDLKLLSDEDGERFGGMLLLLDASGTILVRQPEVPDGTGRAIAGELLAAIRSSAEGQLETDGVDGVDRVFAFTRLADSGATLAVGFDADEILAENDRDVLVSLAALVLALLMSSAGTVLLLKRGVLRWVDALRHAAERISAGALDTTVEVDPRAGELAELAAAFNRMSAELRRRDTDIHEAYTKLEMQSGQLGRTAEDLRSLSRQAEAANAAKSDFLATISHELRTPLNGVIGFSDLLLDSPLNEEQRAWVSLQREAGQALLALINDILDFSRIEAGRLVISERAFDLHALLHGCVSLVSGTASAKGLRLDLDISQRVPRGVQGDDLRIRQVLLNLLSNAVKFTEQGGVRLSVSQVMSPSGPQVRFSVEDTGIGIAADKLPHLFRRFEQVDQSITRRFGGAGLGLAISKRLVQMMGGSIEVESRPGEGSTFSVDLPLRRAALPEVEEIRSRAALTARPGRILVAEDARVNQLLLAALLRNAGHQVDIAVNGEEAFEAVRRQSYDLVLMDMQMPVLDGLEATQRIRELDGPAGQVPIVAVTANALPGEPERCMAAGMNGHLTKPVDRDALAAVLARFLTERAPVGGAEAPARGDDTLAELIDALGEEAVAGMVVAFRDDLRTRLARMEAADGDPAVVAFEAHALRPAAESLGMAEIAAAAAEILAVARVRPVSPEALRAAVAGMRTAAADFVGEPVAAVSA